MKPILLIAMNFLREQRWPLLLLLVWVFASAAGTTLVGEVAADDAMFFLKQQAIYGVAFTTFLGASAIYNERRSRRILAVLSKGIERREYIAGLLTGVLSGALIYCVAMGVAANFMFGHAGLSNRAVWPILILLMAACALTATISILFSTFLNPLLATAATALCVGTSAAVVYVAGEHWANILPVYVLMENILKFSGKDQWTVEWGLVFWAFVESVVIWLAGSWLFSYRDIAVSVE